MGKARRKEKDVTSDDSKIYLQEDFLQCLAVEMKLGELVTLPDGILSQEWVASQTVAFFEHINLIYGTISEFCTMSGCSEMTGPGNKLFFWTDERGKRSKLPAPQYIDYVMTYMQKTLNDESVFPTKADKEFPISFEMHVRKIYRLLLHVLAHIYHMHFNEIVFLDLHKHLNCIFAHLILFNQQFNLIEVKELDILNDLSIALKLVPDNQSESTSATPEPPSPASKTSSLHLNLQSNVDNLLNNKKDNYSLDQNLYLQTNNLVQEHQLQRKKQSHTRQHSFTTSQTISSPTTYIKRFISSLSPNNNNNNSNQSSNNIENHNDQVITTQCKSISPFNVNSNEQDNYEHNYDQETQNRKNQKLNHFPSKKIITSIQEDETKDEEKMEVDNPFFNNKKHRHLLSTPIYFTNQVNSKNTLELSNNHKLFKNKIEENVQLNLNAENQKNVNLFNLSVNNENNSRRTTSESAILSTSSSFNKKNELSNETKSIFNNSIEIENFQTNFLDDENLSQQAIQQSELIENNDQQRSFENLTNDQYNQNKIKASSNRHSVCSLIDSN